MGIEKLRSCFERCELEHILQASKPTDNGMSSAAAGQFMNKIRLSLQHFMVEFMPIKSLFLTFIDSQNDVLFV